MRVATSYFYQIRNFKKNMIPFSTALSDPLWYHDFQGKNHVFKDKRGILNGLRFQSIIVQGAGCPCTLKNPHECCFLNTYEQNLKKLDIHKLFTKVFNFCEEYARAEGLEEEPVAVLIFYETPRNKCSEREVLTKFLNENDIECKELNYPI